MEDIRTASSPFPPAGDVLVPGMDGMKDNLSYEEMMAPVRGRMMRVIWRIVRHHEEAEDTMQEALATIWKKRDRVLHHPNPQALVLKICVNAAVDTLRKKRREERFGSAAAIERLADPAAGSARDLAETEAMVKRAISRLPRKQALAVVMRVLEGYSYGEIGAALGCREATARTHVLRGRAKLSRWLAPLRPSGKEEDS